MRMFFHRIIPHNEKTSEVSSKIYKYSRMDENDRPDYLEQVAQVSYLTMACSGRHVSVLDISRCIAFPSLQN